jgi:tetratricopeptide (TPR) repeat protein
LRRSLKRQIKQDELVTGYEQVGSWTRAHNDEIRATLVGVLVLALVAGGLWYYRSRREADAEQRFDEALQTYSAPVGTNAGVGGFATSQERFKKALAAFEGLAQRFSGMAAGRRARYYVALCRIELADYDAAERALREQASEPEGAHGPVEASLARLALAQLERRRGAFDRAVEAYQKLVEDERTSLPRDHVLMALGQTLEEAHRRKDALGAYRRLVDEYPESPYASEARSRAEYLKLAAEG